MLGERIREVRKNHQMNQTEFSNRIGVSQGTLSELEQNKYNPSLETISAIIKVFNVSAEWLLFGDAVSEGGHGGTTGQLNQIEESLIIKFRMLSKHDREEIMDIIDLKNARRK